MPFLPPPMTRAAREAYLRALTVKHHQLGSPFTNWLAVVQELEAILFAQMDKASGMLAFNGVAVSILALDLSFLPRSPEVLWLLTASAVICLVCCLSIWPSSDEARDSEQEAHHLLMLLATRSALINISVICSLLALLLLSWLPKPQKPPVDPPPPPPMTLVAAIGPFCRGHHDAICPAPRDSASTWLAPVTPARFLDSLRTLLATRTAVRVTIVGSADRTELRARLRERYGENQNLARSRAEWVREGVRQAWPGPSPLPPPLVLTRGAAVLDTALATTQSDRGVLVTVELEGGKRKNE